MRPAASEDSERLLAIDLLASLNPLSGAQYQRACTDGSSLTGLILVAERHGQLCGFVLYSQVLDEGSINNIVVDPAVQGCGYGRALLRHTLALMRKASASRCLLEVRESNRTALALYQAEGFSVDGRRRAYYAVGPGQREDALLMSKQL